jgi:hypothetical protein
LVNKFPRMLSSRTGLLRTQALVAQIRMSMPRCRAASTFSTRKRESRGATETDENSNACWYGRKSAEWPTAD